MGRAGGYNRRSEILASAEDEAGVTGVGDALHFCKYNGSPPGWTSISRFLPGMLAPMYQDCARGNKVAATSSATWSAPGFLRFRCRLDPVRFVTPHVLDARDDEVALQFGAGRPVAERRRALRAVDIKQVREVRARHAQMRRARPLEPFLPQRLAVGAANVDAGQGRP